MANLSNINNKFIVTDVGTGQAVVGATNAVAGSTLTVGGQITASKNQNATSSFTFQNTDTTGTSVRTYLNATAGNRSIRLEAIHSDYSYVVSNNARMYFQTNSGSNNSLFLDGDNATFAGNVTMLQSNSSSSDLINRNTNATATSRFIAQSNTTSQNAQLVSDDNNGYAWVGSSTGGTNRVVFKNNTDAYYEGRNFGIGTSSPVGKLTVSASDGGKGIEMQVTTGSGLQYILAYNRTAGATGYLDMALAGNTFQVQTGASGAQKMFIADNGVTTIGMTNATGAADVRIGFTGDATQNGTGRLKFVNSNSYKSWQISAGGTPTGALAFTQSGTNGADNFNEERMRLASDGSVRIGKNTNYSMSSPYLMIGNTVNTNELILSNQGTTQLGGFDGSVIISTGGSNNLLISSDNGYIAFSYGVSNGYTSYNEAMRITSGGQLLIGKTELDISISDGFRFDPNGEGYASIPSTGANAWHVYDKTNNAYRFYVSGGGQIYATSTSISGLSDITLKENIKPLETGLDDVMKLKPKRFDWKNGDGKNIAGFIAQEVEQVLPDLVSESKYTDEETKKSLKMGDMIPTLVKAIQELKAEVDLLKNK